MALFWVIFVSAMGWLNLQDWTLTDELAGLDIAGLDNEGLDIDGMDKGGPDIDGLDIAGLDRDGRMCAQAVILNINT